MSFGMVTSLLRLGAALSVIVYLGFASSASAQDFCAVTLKVSDSAGKPIKSTWIELIDASGKIVQREMMAGPTARICDFGFGSNSLRVGANECLPVTVSNLRVVIGFPVHLDVTLNSCGYRDQMRNACFVYFRTQDASGDPVPGVDFSPNIADGVPKTDSFGRYQSLFRGPRDIVFSKPGFRSVSVHIDCKSDEEVDKAVVMSPEGPPR